MIIKSVRVQRFRSILDETLPCDPLTVLVGSNGAGKSCFIRAIEMFFSSGAGYEAKDFYGNDTKYPIVITLTFTNLTRDEEESFRKYVRNGELTVEKELEYPPRQRFYGTRLRNPDFSHIREAEAAMEKRSRYRDLAASVAYKGKLLTATSATQVDEYLEAYELANPQECRPTREATQFFGYQQVGGAKLERFVMFRLIPAVRDAAEDAAEGRGSVLTELMDIVVRSALSRSPDLARLREETQKEYEQIVDPARLPELASLESDLSEHLATYAPGAGVKLGWGPISDVQVPAPQAEIQLIEDGYACSVARTGHGLQRAFVLTLLQTLAITRSSAQQDGEAGESAGGNAAVPDLILGIEEPELYQHPNRQRHLSRVLMQLTSDGITGVSGRVQVIYSTHSPLLVDVERIDCVRRLRKTGVGTNLPKKTVVLHATLDQIAAELEKAEDAPQGAFSGSALAARLRGVMTPGVNEVFFTDLAVLTEGEDERAALLAAARARGEDMESLGISVTPCVGKPNVATVAAILKLFYIPCFLVWDSDYPRRGEVAHNHRLLRLCGFPVEDWPERVENGFGCFKESLDKTVRAELGENLFDSLLTTCKTEFSIRKKVHALKNPSVWQRLIEKAAEEDVRSTSLEHMVDVILARRQQLKESL